MQNLEKNMDLNESVQWGIGTQNLYKKLRLGKDVMEGVALMLSNVRFIIK